MNHRPKYKEMNTMSFNWKLWHQNWITPKICLLYFFFFQNTPYVFDLPRPQFSTWGLRVGFYSILRVQRIKFRKKVKTVTLTHAVGFSPERSHIWNLACSALRYSCALKRSTRYRCLEFAIQIVIVTWPLTRHDNSLITILFAYERAVKFSARWDN